MGLTLTELSPSYNQAKVTSDVSMKVLAKAMDTSEQAGEGIVKMIDSAAMERSVNPAVGGNFDMSV